MQRKIIDYYSVAVCFILLLVLARPGPGAAGPAVDRVRRPREADHGLRDLHPGRIHPLQSHGQHCLQLGSPRAD